MVTSPRAALYELLSSPYIRTVMSQREVFDELLEERIPEFTLQRFLLENSYSLVMDSLFCTVSSCVHTSLGSIPEVYLKFTSDDRCEQIKLQRK